MDSNEAMLGLKYPRTLLIYKVYAIKKKKKIKALSSTEQTRREKQMSSHQDGSA